MATFIDPSLADDFAICPYNEHHVMKKNRLPYHLVQCAKNNQHIQLMECPYNRKHRVSSSQYQKHIEQCAQLPQLSMREDILAMADAAKKSVDIVENVENQVLCEWDDSDITGFTNAAPENENVTQQLNQISFSTPVLTHAQGNDSVDEESLVDRKPVISFGVGRGKILNYCSDRKFGAKGVGRALPKNGSFFDAE